MSKIIFPEFINHISIDSQVAYSFDKNYQYNIIVGADFLDKFGFTINYNDNLLQWMDHISQESCWILEQQNVYGSQQPIIPR